MNESVGWSFGALHEEHEHLIERFWEHQEALLSFDLPGALSRLADFEEELQRHMRLEEEVLLPVYAERVTAPPGGAAAQFLREHEMLRDYLARFRGALEALIGRERDSKLQRAVIRLIEEQTRFKGLVEHHDTREENILFPELDRVIGEEERQRMLGQIGDSG